MSIKVIWDYTYYWAVLCQLVFQNRLTDTVLLFAGRPEADEAARFAKKAMDISTFLDQLGLIAPPPLPQPMTIAYHAAYPLTGPLS